MQGNDDGTDGLLGANDQDFDRFSVGLGVVNVYRWANEKRDPTAETVVEIVRALKSMNPEAAEFFVKLYLGNEI